MNRESGGCIKSNGFRVCMTVERPIGPDDAFRAAELNLYLHTEAVLTAKERDELIAEAAAWIRVMLMTRPRTVTQPREQPDRRTDDGADNRDSI